VWDFVLITVPRSRVKTEIYLMIVRRGRKNILVSILYAMLVLAIVLFLFVTPGCACV